MRGLHAAPDRPRAQPRTNGTPRVLARVGPRRRARPRAGCRSRTARGRRDRGRRSGAARPAFRAPHQARHCFLDRPDHDGRRRVLPARGRHRGGAPGLLRLALPGGRGGRDVLRAADATALRAVGGAYAAGLRVRHQGARAAHGPAHRDAAAAEGAPRGTAGALRREAAPVREGPAGRAARRGLAPVRRRPRPARRSRAAGCRVAPVPEVVLHDRPRTATRSARRRPPWSPTGCGSRSSSETGRWFNEKNLERTLSFLSDEAIPLVMVDGPQGFKSSVPPIVAVTSPELAVVRFHGRRTATWEDMGGLATVERFRYLYDRERARGVGAHGSRRRPPTQGTPTSS